MSERKVFLLAMFVTLCSLSPVVASAQAQDRAQAAAEIESLREQIKAREAALLAPAREDLEAHAEFLAQPKTGIVRLLPREKWDHKLSMRGGGSYYSFTKLTHEYGDSSDISLEQGSFGVGFHGADFGFIHLLGDVALETLTLEHAALQFLTSYAPPSKREDVDRFWAGYAGKGHQSGDFLYKRSLPALAGNTYVLRSVSYGDADTLVAFRVVRKDADGSVVLLWKLLKKFPKPELERAPTTTAVAAP